MAVIMKVISITFSKIAKDKCLKLRKIMATYSHLELRFILKVPPRVVILSHQRRN